MKSLLKEKRKMNVENTKIVSLSESAAQRICDLVQEEGTDSFLRIQVQGGGCKGFQYSFDLDKEIQEGDQIFEKNGAKVVVDESSLEVIAGSEVDYKQDLIGAAFLLTNPNASSSCGCGNSFSI